MLGKTLGVPLFQEQAMQVAIICAGFTPSEADQLRRSMATFKVTGGIAHFKEKLISGMVERRYKRAFAEQTVSQIEGFGSYGFPESHAASFALIAYASSWMKCHHPDVFCCALLNAQPMGFYAPAQIVRDAREHGVEVRPVCVNHSRWDCTLERGGGRFLAVRLGLRMVKGLSNAHAAEIVAGRADHAYGSVDELWRRTRVPPAALERLAEADAFQGLGLERRGALWAIRGLRDEVLPLFAAADAGRAPQPEIVEPAVPLVPMPAGRNVVEDYASVGLTLRQHPVAFLGGELRPRGVMPCADLLIEPRRPARHRGGPGAGAAASRDGDGRHLHHPRGRDLHRQPGRLVEPVRAAAANCPVCQHDCVPGPCAARRRCHSRGGGTPRGPVGFAPQCRQPAGTVPSAAWSWRRRHASEWA